ncbi:mandelate racemase/muconate lactonizing enzyme family protein [Paracandidimonas soli]|uniref:L-alanine-DL-glutamate epimerase-like enolase superfamily enzyme n=1 Tax=Paracandidimonas soli TaxID=1917182 RepID=A0A4R3UWQ3_9BURK|nr:mandelate racemase/muconate lactonizing enzyme family protein [Paracandidimonas soli]TCU95213.1 L-alanine-DL-glutamate epimerase-like enolase superfamily enzyme [Paracandidimonas soli]
MSVIESVSVCIARVPLDEPVTFSTRQVTAREYCLIRIRSTDGHEGLGYCYAVNSAGRLLSIAATELLAPKLIGQDSHRVEGLWTEMYQDALLLGRAGAVMRVLSAIDIALWDLNARSASLPLYRYLGATTLDRVPAYASGGYYLPGKTNADLASEMETHVSEGFTAVKMKVGLKSVAQERERMAAVRDAIGDDVRLMLDANNAWRDLPTALEYTQCFEPFNPFWLEEPFSPDDIDNHARLAAATRITIATGEVEAGRWRFKDLIQSGATTLLQTDATVCGGITEWRRIAATAASHGLTVEPHAWHDVHIHLVASTPNSTYVEWMPDDHIVNFRRLIDKQLVAENGQLLLPKDPGLGFRFDEAAVERYGVIYNGEKEKWITVR